MLAANAKRLQARSSLSGFDLARKLPLNVMKFAVDCYSKSSLHSASGKVGNPKSTKLGVTAENRLHSSSLTTIK